MISCARTHRGVIIWSAVVGLLLAGCSAAGGTAAADCGPADLLFGHGSAPDNPRAIAAEAFADEVEQQTDGRISVQVHGSGQVGSDEEMLRAIRSGSLDLSANSQGTLSTFVPQTALIGLPFLFDDAPEAYAVLDGEVGDQLKEVAREQGFEVLGWWDNGIRQVTNSRRGVSTPEDLSGLRIRTPADPMTVDIFGALDANPTPLAFGELYLALRQGTVDGQENPLVNIASARLFEVQSHLAMTRHKYESTPFVMNVDRWESLCDADREVVATAATNARQRQRGLMQERGEQVFDELSQTMEVTEPDTQPFREATSAVYDSWSQQYPDLVRALQQAAADD